MNEKFLGLPAEKQRTIINAGFRAFAKYGYRHASTDMIAREAGISKALLFYYFGSKKAFYLYLYDYAMSIFLDRVADRHNYDETDFFEIFKDAQTTKIEVMYQYPDLAQFLVQGYLEEDDEIASGVDENFQAVLTGSVDRMMKRIDASKFKESITSEQAMNIVVWMSEGFVKGLALATPGDIEAANDRFLDYLDILKQHFYRKEYL